MAFKIIWDKKAIEEVNKLEFGVRSRIVKKIKELEEKLFSKDIKRLKGSEDFRLRIGDYRIIFSIEGNAIIILKVGHRKNIYEK